MEEMEQREFLWWEKNWLINNMDRSKFGGFVILLDFFFLKIIILFLQTTCVLGND